MANSESSSRLATAKTILSTVGSLAATAVVIRGVANDILPYELHDYLFSGIKSFFSKFSNHLTLVIEEFDGLVTNELYEAAHLHLGTKSNPNARRFKISKPEKEKNYTLTIERDEQILDVHENETFTWVWLCKKTDSATFHNHRDISLNFKSEVRSFELTFHKKNKHLAINSYLPCIVQNAKIKKQENRTIKLFTIDHDNMYNINEMWTPVTLDHPSTFDTLAMDSDQKDSILADLERFVRRREFYRKVGRAWKRGYLLYGPPGTGKSSLIAAMANYLNFDVYDLELTDLNRNSELRKLLLGTANKSILVVEDIDCTVELQERLAKRGDDDDDNYDQGRITLSGLLNFVDGLWSSCGDERIIIFTTNHVEKLDPALLRPGRMDVHINMSYCTFSAFKVLASNYLGVKEHVRFKEIEDTIVNGKVTPAEVAEQLLKNDDPNVSLKGLVDFIQLKIKQNEEAEVEAEKAKIELAKKEEAEKEKAELAKKQEAEKAKAELVNKQEKEEESTKSDKEKNEIFGS